MFHACLEYSLTFAMRNQLVAGNNFRITNWRMQNGEWRMENGELLRRSLILHSPFSILFLAKRLNCANHRVPVAHQLHSPFSILHSFSREEIELRQSQSPSRSSASLAILHSFFRFPIFFLSLNILNSNCPPRRCR